MPLSEYEQRVLEQMERQLASDDPRLANTMAKRSRRPVSRYAVASVGVLVGLLLLVVGAASSLPWLGIVGFVVMFASVAFAVAMPHRSAPGPNGVVDEDGSVRSPAKKKPVKRSRSFMSRIEERWDRRRDQNGR